MKKLFLVIILLSACILFSGCQKKQERPTLDYKRKLSKYLPEFKKEYNKSGMIDLSEGPKLRYDSHLGPKDLNFDIKINMKY